MNSVPSDDLHVIIMPFLSVGWMLVSFDPIYMAGGMMHGASLQPLKNLYLVDWKRFACWIWCVIFNLCWFAWWMSTTLCFS